ncbi:MAG: hypothetical protein ACOCQD_02055 [archaeon]
MKGINLNNAERVINELLNISRTLNKLGVKYEKQKPILELAENVYKKEYLPNVELDDEN